MIPAGSPSSAVPAITATGEEDQFSADAQECRPVPGLAADQRVHHQGLQPGVPGAAGLGGAGVDLGGPERDLPGVAEHRLAQFRLAAGRGKLVDLGLDHVDGDAHHLHRLLQAHRPGQLAGRGAEHLAGHGGAALRVLHPVHEGGDAGLRDQADPGAVLRRQGAEPGQPLLHGGHGGGAERAHGLLQPLDRLGPDRARGSGPAGPARRLRGNGHGSSLSRDGAATRDGPTLLGL